MKTRKELVGFLSDINMNYITKDEEIQVLEYLCKGNTYLSSFIESKDLTFEQIAGNIAVDLNIFEKY